MCGCLFSGIFLLSVFVTSTLEQQLSMWECLTLAQSSRAVSNPSQGGDADLLSFKHTVPPLWNQIDCLSAATSFKLFVVRFHSSWVETFCSKKRWWVGVPVWGRKYNKSRNTFAIVKYHKNVQQLAQLSLKISLILTSANTTILQIN